LYPTLRGGVDEYGHSIADLGTNADEAADKLSKQLEAMKKIHAQDIIENLPDVIGKIRAENDELDKEISSYQDNQI